MSRPRWMDTVKVGDVLRAPSGALRVVRAVHRHEPKGGYRVRGRARVFLVFSIKRCSWTGRPYTYKVSTDAIWDGWTHTGHRMRLNKKRDRDLAHDLQARTAAECRISCQRAAETMA